MKIPFFFFTENVQERLSPNMREDDNRDQNAGVLLTPKRALSNISTRSHQVWI
jgi:hypothetical protein